MPRGRHGERYQDAPCSRHAKVHQSRAMSDPQGVAETKEVCVMRRIKWVVAVLAMLVVMVGSAVPAVAHDFGPTIFCDAGTLTNCANHVDPTSAGDAFSCMGNVGGLLSCTSRVTGDSSPHCAFMGNESSSKNRDVYMCGPQSAFSNQTAGEFWQQMDAAQRQGVYP
jgi:hypothetical protein